MAGRPKIKNQTGGKRVKILRDIIEDELGWLFREQPLETDYGIDAHIEIVDSQEVTGKLIAVQIKSGKSYFKNENDEGFIFRGDIEHYNYWVNHSLPVILVLCDTDTKVCYWVQIREDNVEHVSPNSWKITVPKKQVLNRNSSYELMKISENKTSYERKLDKLIIDKPWMDEILKGNKVILESEEWVNKSSGRGSLTIKVIDGNTGEERVEADWPYILLPGWSYVDAFLKLFPWANISVDEDFYDDYDKEQFCLDNAYYDDEEDEWIYDYKDLEYYKKRLPEIRPYLEDGEVAYYRLILELNDLGNAFLVVDRFLREE
jgi:hypothetical protein